MSRGALASAAGLGVLAATGSEDAEAIFLGTGARNAPHDMLGMAKKMEYLGIHRNEIWQKTGWGRGTDGKWRFEMDDSNWFAPVSDVVRLSPLRGDRKYQTTAKHTLDEDGNVSITDHRKYGTALDGSKIGWGINPQGYQNIEGGTELINAYPALAEVQIGRSRIPDPSNWDHGGHGGGAFGGIGQATSPLSSGGFTGTLRWDPIVHQYNEPYGASDGYLGRPPELDMSVIYEPSLGDSADNLDKALEQYRSTMAHETQHAIQSLEAWAPGGFPGGAVRQANYGALFEQQWIDEAVEAAEDGPDQLIDLFAQDQAEMRRLKEERDERWDDPDFDRQANTAAINRLRDDINFMKGRFPYAVEAARYRDLIKSTRGPYETNTNEETYRLLAGEQEAYNTENRLNYTPEQRRRIPPWNSEDRSRSFQTTGAYALSANGRGYDRFGSQERLIANGAIPTSGVEEAEDLVRAGVNRQRANYLVRTQREADNQLERQNVEEYGRFVNASDEERAAMLEEAAAIKAATQGRVSRAAAALTAAAAANANAASVDQEPGVLEELYNESYAGQQAQELGDIITNAGIEQMVDAADRIDFNPAVYDFSGARAAVAASRNELNEIARDIYQYGAADAVEPTGGNQVAGVLQDIGLYEDNSTAALQTGDTLATIGQVGYEMSAPGYLATAPGYIADAQTNIATGDGTWEDYLTLGLESMAGIVPGGRSTIRGAARKYKPGIYQEPGALLEAASAKVAPESPALDEVFGVTRQDLYDIGSSRQGNQEVQLLGAPANPKGTAHAGAVTKPANTQRLVNALENARGSELEKGMVGWYVMDPLYQSYKALGLSDEEAIRRFNDFQAITGIHSANSDVVTELNRGTGALYLNEQGRLDDYFTYGGKMNQPGAPADMDRIRGHMGHKTAHGVPTRQYYETGALQMKSPKVPAYIQAAGVPETGFQTNFPVGDAHFSRAIGLSDVRPELAGGPGASWSMPEALQLAPWWRDDVAGQVGLESVPAQALAWGLYGPQTGVETAIAAPKLEILADMIKERARDRGISIEQAREEILLAQDYVGALTSK